MDAMAKFGDQVLDALKALAAKLGVTVEQIFPYFVKQVWVESLAWVIGWLFAVVALMVTGFLLVKAGKRFPENLEQSAIRLLFGYLLIVLPLVIFGIVVGMNLPGLLNPEYEAVVRIVKMVTGK